MNLNLKKILPHIIAITCFFIITIIYFSPIVFNQKEIRQGDIINHKGISAEIAKFRTEHPGEEPLWTNSLFGGMPAYQVSAVYPSNLIKHVDNLFMLYLPYPIGMVFLNFIGFYILLLCLRINPWVALVGSIAYGFSSYFFIILEAGHNSKAHAIGYLAPLLGSIILTLRGNKLLGGSLTALFTALELYCNHLQITYYLFLLLIILFIVEFVSAIKSGTIKNYFTSLVVLGIALVFGILPNITNLWATYEYGKYSTRGKTELTIKANKQKNSDVVTSGLDRDYATQWSYGKSETFTLLIPNFKGGASESISKTKKEALKDVDPQMKDTVGSMQSYFGDQPFTSGPVYIGAIMIFLAFLGLFIIDSNLKWVLFFGTILSIMLAWGKNLMWFTNLFFDFVPGYNKFRAVSMILVLAELTIPLLAALALDKILTKIKSSNDLFQIPFLKKQITFEKAIITTFSILFGFLLICFLLPGMVNSFDRPNELNEIVNQVHQQNPSANIDEIQTAYAPLIEQVEIARKNIFKSDVQRTFLLILFVAGLIWFYVKQKINKSILIAGIGVLVLFDMWGVCARYLNKENYVSKAQNQTPYLQSKADELILNDQSLDYRVLKLGNPFNDASVSYFHKSIGGYHGAKLKRYQELIDFHIGQEYDKMISLLSTKGVNDSVLQAFLPSAKVLNMLNTKYIIYNEDAPPLYNSFTNGNAWFVNNFKLVNNADEEISSLYSIEPKLTAVLNNKFASEVQGLTIQPDNNASIKLISYQANALVYETKAKSDQLAIFSEIYYPKGWNAYIDGKLTNHFGADYVLRGMKVPSGEHKIEFKFEPSVYFIGEKIALTGSLITILGVIICIYFALKKKPVISESKQNIA